MTRTLFLLASLTFAGLASADDGDDLRKASESLPTSGSASMLDGSLKRFELADGQSIRAKLVEETPTAYNVELADGNRLTLSRASVTRVISERGASAPDGLVWFEDANRTRYFYGPSAMMLKKGQAYFSQKELVFSTIAYGVTDHLSLEAGAVLPAFFLGTEGLNGIIGLKGGGEVTSWLHLAAGIQVLAVPNFGTDVGAVGGGFVFGTATAGTPDQHASLSVAKPFMFSKPGGLQGADSFLVTGSLNKRVAEHVALMTENWFLFPGAPMGYAGSGPRLLTANMIGARVMSEKLAADVGLLWSFNDQGLVTRVPMPWLDFTYNFEAFSG